MRMRGFPYLADAALPAIGAKSSRRPQHFVRQTERARLGVQFPPGTRRLRVRVLLRDFRYH